MYESPVRIFETEPNVIMRDIAKKMTENFDDAVMMEIQHTYHIDVDKDELVRALKYDRDQYDKGFKDGMSAMLEKMTDYGYNVCLLCKHVGCDYSKEPCSKCKEMYNTICDGSYFELEED